jgi:hypothetical protein
MGQPVSCGRLLWGLNNRIDYKPPLDSLIFGMDIKVVKK